MGFAQNRDSVAMVSNLLYTIGLLFGVPRHSSFFLETRSLGGGGGGGGFASASGWLSQRLTSCRRHLSSSWRSAASCPLTPPLPFASCMPPLPFASFLPAGCRVAPVVAPPPTPPRNLRHCLDLFFAIWLPQLAMPHLSCRQRLSTSSRFCLATRRLRLSTHHRIAAS